MSIYKIIVKSEHSKMLFFGDKADYKSHLTERQLRNFSEDNIIFSDYTIYCDDSIQTVKNKILMTLNFDYCYEEMYLYGKEERELPEDVLTAYQDERAFKKNVKKTDDAYEVKRLIGHKYDGVYDYLFPVDPYDYRDEEKTLFDLENSVLLSFVGQTNTLHLCLCEDVIGHTENDAVIKIYFPLLHKEKVDTISKLSTQRNKLIAKNKKNIPEELKKMYRCVDAVQAVNVLQPRPLEFKENGIKTFEIALKTPYKILPLDAIFKSIHSTKDIPFIKYNPGTNRDTFYRLYSNKLAKNGRKIPLLKISEVLKYSREIGKGEQIAIAIYKKYIETQKNAHIIILRNGQLVIGGTFKTAISVKELEVMLLSIFDDIVEKINDSIEHIGYNIPRFSGLNDYNIVIRNLEYFYSLNISKKIQISKYRNLFYPIFLFKSTNIESDSGAELVFKRVDNYISMNAVDELIALTRKRTENVQEIIAELITELHLDEETARNHVIDFFGQHRILDGELVDSVGFPIVISLNKSTNTLTFVSKEITKIDYIFALRFYFDAVIKLFEKADDLEDHIKEIERLTKKEINESVIEKTKQIPVITAVTMDSEIDSDFFSVGVSDKITGVTEDDDEEIVGMMDEDDEEEEIFGMMDEESDEEEEIAGGAGDLEINVTGMRLNNPNPFYERIEKRDPKFVLKKDSGKYNSYSRTCPPAEKRQPIILNKTEMENIEKHHRDSYNVAMKYSTKENEQFWYICPRYWSLKDNTSLTEKEVEKIVAKTPDAIIPQGAKTVPEGSYIYEFKHPKQHINAKGEYIYQYPGLIHDAHPDGYAVPCCFKRPRKEEAKKTEKQYNYIVDSIKYPVPDQRQGFLPLPVQLFFNNNAKECVSKTNSALLEPGVKCLLRVGSEQNILNSFIGAIASAYAEEHNRNKNIPKIEEMMDIICNSLTIDSFIDLNNASLVSVFKSKTSSRVDIDGYKTSKLYKMLNTKSDDEMDFFKETVKSFENFKKYISDTSAFIDHTFLWEIVCEPNLRLFKEGVNLIILEINRGKLRILCPTNPYSQRDLDKRRKSLVLVKQDDFYEIICLQDSKKTIKLLPNDEPIISDSLNFVFNNVERFCKPKKSLLTYGYDQALLATAMEHVFNKHAIAIKGKVMNFQAKVVGFNVGIFVPSLPSTLPEKRTLKGDFFINNMKLYKPYGVTLEKLREIYEKCQRQIPCNPVKKVVENGYVHGIRTNSNQYVKVTPNIPLTSTDDDLIVEHSSDYIEADIDVTLNDKSDKELRIVKDVHLETKYFSVFRTVVRILLNRRESAKLKERLYEIIHDSDKDYTEKLKKISELLVSLTEDHVEFSNVDVKKITEVNSCFRNCKSKDTCKHKGDICVFEIPKFHLLQPDLDNSIFYYVKLADELLRVGGIYAFIMEPQRFLNYNNMRYSVNDDEILLVDAFVTHDYFNELEIMNNEFIGNISYDIAEPDKSQVYLHSVEKK